MPDPRQTIEDYLKAFYSGDPGARRFLADDFRFSGPSSKFDSADAFLKAAAHAAAGTEMIKIDKAVSEGQDVCVFYTLHLDHRVATSAVAEWFQLDEGGRIASSRMILDTAPFLPPRATTALREYAVDPVCHMQVDKGAPAATGEHAGVTYYFCSTGCAHAFAKAPTDYLDA